ncbi:MAG: hypothetical protein M1819_005715 [Sarea resinae]|nr:MAG: hypothetical protein M1819_005715 [Sarea resinae]
MIELGLGRIGRLLAHSILPWRAIHVAGTNGKGSICAYLSAMLQAGNIRCGRFTSPHLIDRWDCVTIDEKPVSEALFREVEDNVIRRNEKLAVGASQFELLTATAFEIFTREKIDIGVVEVGLGGRLDATNILKDPLVTIISKIGRDHQLFLGNSIEEIAREKAGIMKPGVPCVFDSTNDAVVQEVFRLAATEVEAGPLYPVPDTAANHERTPWDILSKDRFADHQQVNLACAHKALVLALQKAHPDIDPYELLPSVANVCWPGRLQSVSIQPLTGRSSSILLDGAHNAQSAEVLRLHVNKRLRSKGQNVTWVVALSNGKDVEDIFGSLIEPGDLVAAVAFGPVDGMPWVKSTDPTKLLKHISANTSHGCTLNAGEDVLAALKWASDISANGPLVVAGSLYLVSDVLRILRSVGTRI